MASENTTIVPEKNEYYPLLIVDESELLAAGGDETQMVMERLQAYAQLPEESKKIFQSDNLPLRLYQMEQKFGLQTASIGRISILLRWMFFGKITWNDFVMRIDSILLGEGMPHEKTQELAGFIHQMLTEIAAEEVPVEPTESSEESSTIDQKSILYLPILKALSTYPELRYQRITSDKIVMKGEHEPVPPTIRNWLRVYRDEVGVGQHSTVERGQFLFQSDNTKTLSTSDREVLSLLVKSIEEEAPLLVDTEKKIILFQSPPATTENSMPAPSAEVSQPIRPSLRFESTPEPPTPILNEGETGELSFSSGQQLQSEQEDAWKPKE